MHEQSIRIKEWLDESSDLHKKTLRSFLKKIKRFRFTMYRDESLLDQEPLRFEGWIPDRESDGGSCSVYTDF